MASMIKRKSTSFFRGGSKKGQGKKGGKGKPLRFGSGTGFSTGFNKRSGEAPDAYLGAVDASAGFSPALLRQALFLFYARFNPEKENIDELFDILLYYTAKQGLDALNIKLKLKYGASLDDIDLPDWDYDDEDEEEEYEPPPPGDWGIDPNAEPPPPPQFDDLKDYALDSNSLPPPPLDPDEAPKTKTSLRKSLFRRSRSMRRKQK